MQSATKCTKINNICFFSNCKHIGCTIVCVLSACIPLRSPRWIHGHTSWQPHFSRKETTGKWVIYQRGLSLGWIALLEMKRGHTVVTSFKTDQKSPLPLFELLLHNDSSFWQMLCLDFLSLGRWWCHSLLFESILGSVFLVSIYLATSFLLSSVVNAFLCPLI